MIKSHRIHEKRLKTLFTVWKYLPFFGDIFKFEKCVKYANEGSDDIIDSIQFREHSQELVGAGGGGD